MIRTAVVSDKQLGDVLLLEPMTRLLSIHDGGPVSLYVNKSFAPMVELMPNAVAGGQADRHEHLWCTSWGSRSGWKSFCIAARLKTLIVSQHVRRRPWFRLVFDEMLHQDMRAEYWAKYFWRAVGGVAESFLPPVLDMPPSSWAHEDLPKQDYCVINPTAAWQNKFWESKRWCELLGSLCLPEGMPVVMTGGGSDTEMLHCAAILGGSKIPLVSLAGRTSLRQYLHALSRARLLVTVDGSASHLAQAFDVPTVTLFGPTYSSLWHWQTPRNVKVCASEVEKDVQPPMDEVDLPRVIEAISRLRGVLGY